MNSLRGAPDQRTVPYAPDRQSVSLVESCAVVRCTQYQRLTFCNSAPDRAARFFLMFPAFGGLRGRLTSNSSVSDTALEIAFASFVSAAAMAGINFANFGSTAALFDFEMVHSTHRAMGGSVVTLSHR
jgi:hypothetical protein